MEKWPRGTAWKSGDNISADEARQFHKNMDVGLNKNALGKICMTGYALTSRINHSL